MKQNQAALQSNLSTLGKICNELAQANTIAAADDERRDALNVQSALGELGHHGSLEVAAAVWRHHSSDVGV